MARVRTTPRKKPKQARSAATVAAVLEATVHVLVREGYTGASTNKIAQVAGVSIGSLYQYFPSKEALIAALIERHVSDMRTLLETKLAEQVAAPLDEAVRAMIGAMIAAHRINPKLHRVVTSQVPRLGRLDRLLDLETQVESLIRTYLEMRKEQIRPKNLELAAFILVHSVEAITHAAVQTHHNYIDDEELVDEISELVLRYLRAEPN